MVLRLATIAIIDAKEKGWNIVSAALDHAEEYEKDPSAKNLADVLWIGIARGPHASGAAAIESIDDAVLNLIEPEQDEGVVDRLIELLARYQETGRLTRKAIPLPMQVEEVAAKIENALHELDDVHPNKFRDGWEFLARARTSANSAADHYRAAAKAMK